MAQDTLLTGVRSSQIRLIASYWVRFSLRTGGGLIALLAILIVGLSVAAAFVSPMEAMMRSAPELGHSEKEAAAEIDRIAQSDQCVTLVEGVTGSEEAQVRYLLQDNPAILSAIFIVLLMIYPFLACLSAFNQTSGDIANRGLRYLLLRTERPNIFLGRFLGTFYFTAASIAGVMVLLLLYIGLKFQIYPAGDLAMWGLQGFIAFVMICLPYIAMCAWMSGLIDSPFGSLAICLLLTGFPILFLKMADVAVRGSDLEWLMKLLPWGWKYDLVSHDMGTRLVAYAAMIAFTAFFMFIGLRAFKNRDL